jgi:uncharacterized membrane protein YeaQ/YmgE (transglycosylase-associated protein family)
VTGRNALATKPVVTRRLLHHGPPAIFYASRKKTTGILRTILIGLIVGIVAKFLMPGRDPAGFIIAVVIGIVGSIFATFLGRTMGFYQVGESAGFIAAVLGAIILLFLYRMVAGKRG